MKKIIDVPEDYFFYFSENKSNLGNHPCSDYYLKLNDLSINLIISLKWIKWGFFFMTSLSENLDKLKDGYELESIISNSIQIKKYTIHEESKKIITIDNEIINEKSLSEIINYYIDDDFSKLFDDNTKIHLKLKINLREFLIISHELFPNISKD